MGKLSDIVKNFIDKKPQELPKFQSKNTKVCKCGAVHNNIHPGCSDECLEIWFKDNNVPNGRR